MIGASKRLLVLILGSSLVLNLYIMKRVLSSLIAGASIVFHFENAQTLTDLYNNLGMEKYKKGLKDSAIFFFKKSLLEDPQNIGVLDNLGMVKYSIGQYDSAEFFYHMALRIDSMHPNSLYNLALTKNKLVQIDSAHHYFRQAALADPEDERFPFSLGVIQYRMGHR